MPTPAYLQMHRLAFIAAALAFAGSPLMAQHRRAVEYDISFPNAEQHDVHVTAVFRGIPAGQPLQLRMSRSSPGRYAIHNFAKNVDSVRAVDGRGRPLTITRPDPHGWTLRGHDGTVTVTYSVWGDRTDGTYLGVDRSHAHMNMPATFLWARGMTAVPIRLTIHPRAGWRVITQLKPTTDSTVFTAPHLQYFMDSPTEVGPATVRTWQASHGGRSYTWRLAVHHVGSEAQVDSFASLATRVVAEHVAMWGSPAPYDFGTYTFIADYLPWASGDGMEHRNSTIISSRRSLATRADRLANLGTLSHEFFHSWNVERLRPAALEPFDFERENMSGELWFAEGFTSYYDDLMIRRAGIYSDEEYVESLAGTVIATINAPGRRHFSAVEMSMQAPFVDAAASIDPTDRSNRFLSYYTWGAAIGLGLDLTLRTRFDVTLDDYMRVMWREFGQYQTAALAPAKPYSLRDLRRVLGTVTRDTAFANDFFGRYIEGREVVEYERLLAAAGFRLAKSAPGRPYIGASLDSDTAGVFVNWSAEGSGMYAAGIASGDIIRTVDGERTTTIDAINAIVARHKVGDVLQLEIMQRGERRTVPMALVENPALRLTTYESAGMPVTEAMQAFRRAWLASKARQ